jgi:hypothetical protein
LDYGEEADVDENDQYLKEYDAESFPGDTPKHPRIISLGIPGIRTRKIERFFKCGKKSVESWRCESHSMACGTCIPDGPGGYLVSHLPACKPLVNRSDIDWWAHNLFKPRSRNLCIFPEVSDYIALFDYFPNTTFLLEYESPWTWIDLIKHGKEPETLRNLFVECKFAEARDGKQVNDFDLIQWFHSHYISIKEEVKRRPNMSFVYVDMDREDAGMVLSEAFPSIPDTCWVTDKHYNNRTNQTDRDPVYDSDIQYFVQKNKGRSFSRTITITLITLGSSFVCLILIVCFGRGIIRSCKASVLSPRYAGYAHPRLRAYSDTFDRSIRSANSNGSNPFSLPSLPSLVRMKPVKKKRAGFATASFSDQFNKKVDEKNIDNDTDDEHYYGDVEEHQHGL